MSTQSYHISKQVLISAAKAFMDECKSTGIVPDQTVKSISNGTFNVRKEIGLKKKRAEMKRLRRKMLEEKRDKEISDAKEKLRNLESDITTKMSKVNLNSGEGVYGAFGTPKHTPTKVNEKVIKPRYISVPNPPKVNEKLIKPRYISVLHSPKVPSATDPDTTSPASSFDDSVLDPDYNPHRSDDQYEL